MTLEKVVNVPPLLDFNNFELKVEEMPSTVGWFPGNVPPPQTNPIVHTDMPVNFTIQRDQSIKIILDWIQSGWLATPGAPPPAICDFFKYRIEVLFEKMGPGTDKSYPVDPAEVVDFVNDALCCKDVVVPANFLDEGLYKMLVMFKFRNVYPSPSNYNDWLGAFKEVGFVNVIKQTFPSP